MREQATKHDKDKPRVDLVPFDAIEAAAEVFGWAARTKYTEWNWVAGTGLEWHRLARAAISHMGKWAMGEETDPDSGLSHLAHALCCLMMLMTYSRRNHGTDDRPKLPWFAQKGVKDASSDTVPAPSSEAQAKGQETLAPGDEVTASIMQPEGHCEPKLGRVVGFVDGFVVVRFLNNYTNLDYRILARDVRKVASSGTVPTPSSEAPKRSVCLTCGRMNNACTAMGGSILCNSVIETYPLDEEGEGYIP